MKYKGKYSLNENLIQGRGLGLLKEAVEVIENPDGTFQAKKADGTLTKKFDNKRSAISSAASFGGSITQAGLSGYLQGMGHTGQDPKTKAALPAPYNGKGARDVDIMGVDPNGVVYKAELGRHDKVLQLGAMNADGTFKGTKPNIQKAIAKNDPGPYYISGPMAQRAGAPAGTGKTMFDAQTVLDIWLNCGDDLLIYDAGGSYKALALTDKGASVDFGGKKIRKITLADCQECGMQSSGGGSIRGGINAFDIAPSPGGVKVASMQDL